jgi:hypothetical protein
MSSYSMIAGSRNVQATLSSTEVNTAIFAGSITNFSIQLAEDNLA